MKRRAILLSAVLAGVVLVVPVQDRHPEPEQPPQQAVPAAAKAEPQRPRPGFLSAHLDASYRFMPVVGGNPERICDKLDEAGFANSGWRGAQIAGVWECMALLEGEEIEQAASPADSMFYLLRGRAGRRINYARMKINLLDPATQAATLADAARFLEVFSATAGFDLPADLPAAILSKTPASIVTRDVNFKLKPEFDDPDRFNLSIEFGPTLYSFYRTPAPATSRVTGNAATTDSQDSKGARLRKAP